MNQPSLAPLLIATGNLHKVREIGQILQTLPGLDNLKLMSAADFPHLDPPEENGETFEANALLKARTYTRATGLLTLADDSGLVVEALGGRPGVYSARYAETSALANARLLSELQGVPPERRGARFECAMVLADPRGGWVIRRGMLAGRVAEKVRGEGGFGYDPIFELIDGPHAGRSVAELDALEKNRLSHRGRALAAIAPCLGPSLLAGHVIESN